MTRRPHKALQLRKPVPATLADGFPTSEIAAGTRYFRSFSKGNGPWYFNSSTAQRFNLPSPEGTCYVATDVLTAVLERLGEQLADGPISADEIDRMHVASLELQARVTSALTGHKKAAAFGCNREICTTEDYALTQEWASAFRALPVEAVSYESRLSSESKMNALALFGPEGDAGHPVRSQLSGRNAMRHAGLSNLIAPSRPKGKTMKSLLAPDPLRRP
jgi:hypothetical protein